MSEPKTQKWPARMHDAAKTILIMGCFFAFAFGSVCGLDYAGKNFKGPKVNPAWEEEQDKICHAKCSLQWEIKP